MNTTSTEGRDPILLSPPSATDPVESRRVRREHQDRGASVFKIFLNDTVPVRNLPPKESLFPKKENPPREGEARRRKEGSTNQGGSLLSRS